MSASASTAIPLVPMLDALREWRSDEIIISSMSAAREWVKFPEHPLDLIYLPSAMGQPTSLGLGLALAQPQRHVIVLMGDGSLLLNLGSLVTIAAARPENLTLILLDNGIYEVTGGQKTAGAVASVDFLALARAAGVPSVVSFDNLSNWNEGLAGAMQQTGPRLLHVRTSPTTDDPHLPIPTPIVERLVRFRKAIGIS